MDNKTTLQSHNARLETLLDEVNALPDVGNGSSSFPYKITVNSLGLDCEPLFCYGDDGDTVLIATKANFVGIYTANYTCTGCSLFYTNIDNYGLGDFIVVNQFTSDATIEILWKIEDSGQ